MIRRVLLVDDKPHVFRGLSQVLFSEPHERLGGGWLDRAGSGLAGIFWRRPS